MKSKHPIAVCFADLHLTLVQPACRADTDWMAVQAHYLQQLKDIAGDLPIICAGDIFDRWNASPELINFALKSLPDGMLCVPGQHDLPCHQIEEMHRSGYGVLKEAKKIIDLSDRKNNYGLEGVLYYGFGWDQEIKPPLPLKQSDLIYLNIAVIHRYCWISYHSFPGAPETAHVSAFKKELKGYDIAIYGDNHKSFDATSGDCTVFNCGGFLRRRSDEMEHQPSVGIIFSDGSIQRKYLDTSIDKFHANAKDREETPFDMQSFIKGLGELGEHGLDFRQSVENYLKKEEIDPETKQIIMQSLESHLTNE